MQKGTVKWFDSRDGKTFGFIAIEGGGEIFFHLNDARPVVVDSAKRKVVFSEDPSRFVAPKQGDRVVFIAHQGSRGDVASPWCYALPYEKALEALAKLPPPTIYRVLETTNDVGSPAGEPKVLWEGSDLDALLARYPLPSGHQSPSADPLLPYYSDSDNIFEVHRWFEYKDGEIWKPTSDPRPLSGANRQFERISRR